jgi:hypothetical protein
VDPEGGAAAVWALPLVEAGGVDGALLVFGGAALELAAGWA